MLYPFVDGAISFRVYGILTSPFSLPCSGRTSPLYSPLQGSKSAPSDLPQDFSFYLSGLFLLLPPDTPTLTIVGFLPLSYTLTCLHSLFVYHTRFLRSVNPPTCTDLFLRFDSRVSRSLPVWDSDDIIRVQT